MTNRRLRKLLSAAIVAVLAGPLTTVAMEPVQLAQASDRQSVALAIQEALIQRGFDIGWPDGRVGPKTRKAIRAYQRRAGLPVNGEPGRELLVHLRAAPATPEPIPRQAAAPRSRNDLVLAVQRELQVRAYYTGQLDGATGPGTASAVRAFQRDAGFPITGEVDERLLAELRIVPSEIRAGPRR